METTLIAKFAMLLTGTMLLGAFGTFCGRQFKSLGALIGLGLGFLVGAIVTLVLAKVNAVAGVVSLGIWAYISGLFIGPTIHYRAKNLGWQTVFLVFLGSAGAMASFGAYGLLSGHDFSGMGFWLGIALFGLIIFGVIGIFVRFSRQVNVVYSLFGLVIFSGYFIYDFFRLGHSENTWFNATELAMNVYLDFVNWFLFALQLLDKHN